MSGDGYSGEVWVEIDRIDPRPASEMRAAVDEEAVEAYAESFDDLPPIKVMCDADDVHWTVDGSYRLRAAAKLKKKRIKCIIKQGIYLEAFHAAARENQEHGVRITNADKRRRVEVALEHPNLKERSSRYIAELCGVHHRVVLNLRPDNDQLDTVSSSLVGKDGKSRPSKRKPSRNGKPKPEANGTPAVTAPTPEPKLSPVAPVETTASVSGPAVEASPESVTNVTLLPEPEPGPDSEACFQQVNASIRAAFDALPEDERFSFAIKLQSLAAELFDLCPGCIDRGDRDLVIRSDDDE